MQTLLSLSSCCPLTVQSSLWTQYSVIVCGILDVLLIRISSMSPRGVLLGKTSSSFLGLGVLGYYILCRLLCLRLFILSLIMSACLSVLCCDMCSSCLFWVSVFLSYGLEDSLRLLVVFFSSHIVFSLSMLQGAVDNEVMSICVLFCLPLADVDCVMVLLLVLFCYGALVSEVISI